MDENSKQWITMGAPATDDEKRALSDVRKLLADVNTTWAWANLTFVAHDGQSSEVDVILLNHNGLFLLELKGWHGRIIGDQQYWRVTDPNGKVRTAPNPLHSTTLKAKRLKSLLERPWNWQWSVSRVWNAKRATAPDLEAIAETVTEDCRTT